MTTTQKKQTSKIYKVISSIFSIILLIGGLTELPTGIDKENFIIICMIVTVLASALETYFNPNLSNKILWVQIVGAIGFTAGGLLDHFSVFQFSELATEWVRFGLILAWKISDYIIKEFEPILSE
jgi:hypothetical protein